MRRILYLHGFASGPTSGKGRFFREYLESRGMSVTVPDLEGGDFENLTLTGQLAIVARHAGAGPVSLMGSSMGGYLAALYAARHPEVERLILLAPGFEFGRRWPDYLGTEKMDEWRRTGYLEFYHYAQGRNRRLSYALQTDAMQYEDFPDFRQPALIFHGRQDDVVPATASEEFLATHPNVQLELLDSGHDLHDMLEYMAPKVAEFLSA